MPQIFHPSFNAISRVSLFGAALAPLLLLFAVDRLNRSQAATGEHLAVEQPVPFSHQHHVAGVGLDCRYCHGPVERGPNAGIPSAQLCMGCHREVWPDAPILAPVRESARTGLPIRWRRVHDLPDFAYFDHQIHVAKGVGCESCHGRVDRMPLVWRTAPLTMRWCLDCHRAPERELRPREAIFTMGWQPSGDRLALGRDLASRHGVRSLTHCTTCHR